MTHDTREMEGEDGVRDIGVDAACAGSGKRDKKECLEGESNSHLRITQAMLGHIDDRYETFVLAVILSRLDAQKSALMDDNRQPTWCRQLNSRSHHISSMLLYFRTDHINEMFHAHLRQLSRSTACSMYRHRFW